MIVIPAVDISEGQVVRLKRGDMAQRTVYSDDPVAVARKWADQGAEILHVVDLDGAMAGEPRNLEALAAIAAAVETPVEFGGGLRSLEHVRAARDAGARWIVLGTAAIVDRKFLADAGGMLGDDLVVAIDARDGKVAVEGWQWTSDVDAADLAWQMAAAKVRRLLCTDIAGDGMLAGPNLAGLRRIAEVANAEIIASGGVSAVEDIVALRELEPLGIIAVIAGRALYEGRLDLREAIAAGRR